MHKVGVVPGYYGGQCGSKEESGVVNRRVSAGIEPGWPEHSSQVCHS